MNKFQTLLFTITAIQLVHGAPQFSMTKISCNFNPDFIANSSCQLKPINRNIKQFKIQFFTYKPFNSMQIRVRNLKKSTSNRYTPGLFDITKDLCELMAQNSSSMYLIGFLNTLYKKSSDKLLPLVRPCPYTGWVVYEEDEDQSKPSLSVLQSGEYQTDITLTSKENIQFLNVKTFFIINSRKLW